MSKVSLPSWDKELNRYVDTVDNNVFCVRPWTDVHIHNDSKMTPCCYYRRSTVPGAGQFNTVDEYWDSLYLKDIQGMMLSGISPPGCSVCTRLEALSESNKSPRFYANVINIDEQLKDKRSKTFDNLRNIEIRPSNVCNFRCRTCNPENSSLIASEAKSLGILVSTNKLIRIGSKQATELLSSIETKLDSIQSITFTGGEPMLQALHWQVLNMLIDSGLPHALNIKLNYTSNGSLLEHEKNSVFDLWRYFPNICYSISIDAMGKNGEQAEYWRDGTNWEKLLLNISMVRKHLPHVDIRVNTTVAWPNALSVITLLEFLKGFSPVKAVRLMPLHEPAHFSLWSCPEFKKDEIEYAFANYKDEPNKLSIEGGQTLSQLIAYMRAKNSMPVTDISERLLREFRIDKSRNQDFFTAFPEHENMRDVLLCPTI